MADLLGSSLRDGYLNRLNQERESVKNHLAEGSVQDFETFKRLTGVIEGLNFL